ncbi:MAG: hypothetical protein IJB47_03515 [Oscillospiraceae bacterium]|nr:hypothetical protein [Oscillospiraceae bacterium]
MVRISDITMKQSAEGFSLSFKEKIELAKQLDKLGVYAIELEGLSGSRTDALRVKSIASAVTGSIVAVPVGLDPDTIAPVWAALQQAKHPRLQVCAPVSPVQMEYLFHKKPEAMLCAITETVSACAAVCDTEFVAEDATRSEPAFLHSAITAAIAAGAKTITVWDTAGTMLPGEFSDFIKNLQEAVPALSTVTLGIGCANTLSMADSCAIAAVLQGAGEVKTAAYPINCPSLANVSRIIATKEDSFGTSTGIHTHQLSRAIDQITWMCQSGRGKSSPFGVSAEEDSGIYLTAHDDLAGVTRAVERLGYDLSEDDYVKVFDAFQTIAAKKEQVSTKELDAIVASAAMQVPSTYRLDNYVITSGSAVSATAHMKLFKNDTPMEGVYLGDGPIDAAFLAIERITGRHYELDDFQIQSVTEGREAMGQTVVKLRSGGKVYSGRGISTDIVGASIHAYLSALNKIVYEEEEV